MYKYFGKLANSLWNAESDFLCLNLYTACFPIFYFVLFQASFIMETVLKGGINP